MALLQRVRGGRQQHLQMLKGPLPLVKMMKIPNSGEVGISRRRLGQHVAKWIGFFRHKRSLTICFFLCVLLQERSGRGSGKCSVECRDFPS